MTHATITVRGCRVGPLPSEYGIYAEGVDCRGDFRSRDRSEFYPGYSAFDWDARSYQYYYLFEDEPPFELFWTDGKGIDSTCKVGKKHMYALLSSEMELAFKDAFRLLDECCVEDVAEAFRMNPDAFIYRGSLSFAGHLIMGEFDSEPSDRGSDRRMFNPTEARIRTRTELRELYLAYCGGEWMHRYTEPFDGGHIDDYRSENRIVFLPKPIRIAS